MDLTVLGCRARMPADGQARSGYLVTAGTTRLLLDCGPGVATVLSGRADVAGLSGVLISHLHVDHCYDLLPLGKTLLTRQLAAAGTIPSAATDDIPRWDRVPLYVPCGGAAVLGRLAALFPVISAPVLDRAFELAFDVREYGPGDRVRIGECEVRFHELRHVVPNCGMRVEAGGTVLAHTGDTGFTDGLLPLAVDADLLLAEATLREPDPGPHGHLAAVEAGRVAAEVRVGHLVLTHFTATDEAWLEGRRAEAVDEFGGTVSVALPGRTFAVGG